MKFNCEHCDQRIECAANLVGLGAKCPACRKRIVVPERKLMPPPVPVALQKIVPSEQSPPKQVDSEAVKRIKLAYRDKYLAGEMVASGGMGTVLKITEANLQRQVAMKVMLGHLIDKPTEVKRFFDEAQVSGQLEHPGIVPVYEIGFDPAGSPYYTMRLVKGRNLHEIFWGLSQGDQATKEEFTLRRLLTILMRVCDAIAFAHSKRVIHRDLKPANIMVGEFGEVQVMDWGIAKLLPETTGADEVEKDEVESEVNVPPAVFIEGGNVQTLFGMVFGSPQYMAPEQAMGKTHELSEQNDIYSLGCILYQILTLKPPIEGDQVEELLRKAASGDFPPPSVHTGDKDKGGAVLSHLPDGMVPEALEAVCMRALAFAKKDRYATVKGFQKEIDAYLSGFATQAEKASRLKQARLFIARHRTVCIAGAVAAMLILTTAVSAFVINFRARASAEESLAALQEERIARDKDRKLNAPYLIAVAKQNLLENDLDQAMELAASASRADPDLEEAHLVLAGLHVVRLEWEEAIDHCKEIESLRKGKNDAAVVRLAELCEQARDSGEAPIDEIANQFADLNLPAIAASLEVSNSKQLEVFSEKFAQVWSGAENSLQWRRDRGLVLDLNGKDVKGVLDLEPLNGIGLHHLIVKDQALLTDISALSEMKSLRTLDLSGTRISDLTPLKDLRLNVLDISNTQIVDLRPLKGLPLRQLHMRNMENLESLEGLEDVPLVGLSVTKSKITGISELRRAPLEYLDLSRNEWLSNINALQGKRSLEELRLNHSRSITAFGALTDLRIKRLYLDGMKHLDLRQISGLPLEFLSIKSRGTYNFAPLLNRKIQRIDIGKDTKVVLANEKLLREIVEGDVEAARKEASRFRKLWKDRKLFIKKGVKGMSRHVRPLEMGLKRMKEDDFETIFTGPKVTFEGSRYQHISYPMSWEDAASFAESVGGQLAMINSEAEFEFIARKLLKGLIRPTFLGGRKTLDGEWEWVNGDPMKDVGVIKEAGEDLVRQTVYLQMAYAQLLAGGQGGASGDFVIEWNTDA